MNALERADQAKALLEDATFKALQAEIRSDLVAAIERVPATDVERMQELVVALQVHNRNLKKLEQWVADGKVEQKRLDDLNYRDRIRQVWDRTREFVSG